MTDKGTNRKFGFGILLVWFGWFESEEERKECMRSGERMRQPGTVLSEYDFMNDYVGAHVSLVIYNFL